MRYECENCNARFRTQDTTEHDDLQCPKCGGLLWLAKDESAPEPEQPPLADTPELEGELGKPSFRERLAPALRVTGSAALRGLSWLRALCRWFTPRRALALLLIWTFVHVLLWSAADPPFRFWRQSHKHRNWFVQEHPDTVLHEVGRAPTLQKELSSRYYTRCWHYFWPFVQEELWDEWPGSGGKRVSYTFLLCVAPTYYHVSAFILYVGGAWTAFGCWLLLRRKPPAPPQ